MDLLTAVSVSMLSVARSRAAATFKSLRETVPRLSLEQLVEALGTCGDGPHGSAELCEKARQRAESALERGPDAGMEPMRGLTRVIHLFSHVSWIRHPSCGFGAMAGFSACLPSPLSARAQDRRTLLRWPSGSARS